MSTTTYDQIMGIAADGPHKSSTKALGDRLVCFRRWLKDEAHATVHPAVCIVNGEATDGTKNAPVLLLDRSGSHVGSGQQQQHQLQHESSSSNNNNKFDGRLGVIDGDSSTALYDRTMGCQVRAVREMKKGDVMLELPRASMLTPDLVAASDAGRAVLACCKARETNHSFWDALENTTECISRLNPKVVRNTGPQTLVKILQERKKAETLFRKASSGEGKALKLAEPGIVSTRAPFLAFLIHQRFNDSEEVQVTSEKFYDTREEGNALSSVETTITFPPDAPETFSPYARTLPSSVSLPLCWKRNELALLAAFIPGLNILHEVASSTLQLVAEFVALLDAGILERFPDIFPPGLITWERWVWAAAVFSSRNLPSSSYFVSEKEHKITDDATENSTCQSPREVWNELGVLVPLLDMLNHEIDEHQVTWQQSNQENDSESNVPKAVLHKKVKKGAEIYCCYGTLSNQNLLLQYGFAQMSNISDNVRLGWSLADAVGNVGPPPDFEPNFELLSDYVYESNDEDSIEAWWSEARIELLRKEVFSNVDHNFFSTLKSGRKMTATAYNDGTYHPILLAAAVIATMPSNSLQKHVSTLKDEKLVITKSHQRVLKRYLQFVFTRKLEKLLQNLDHGLEGHFANVKLWTKSSQGGLNYVATEGNNGDGLTGWQSFFDAHAYKTAMEVENHYYSMGIESCVLALYDGHLHSLQVAVSGVSDDELFAAGALKQLGDLGFIVSNEDDAEDECVVTSSRSKDKHNSMQNKKLNASQTASGEIDSNKTPAIKLHVGNLSYLTTPADLYKYFSSVYGQGNVLECHIPNERDTGKSRGFGFVAMPEEVAQRALLASSKHEVDGRVLKIARSNSAGSVNASKTSEGQPKRASDRCLTCGYRPKYCVCPRPNIPGYTGIHGSGDAVNLPPPGMGAARGSYTEPPKDYRHSSWDYGHQGGPRRDSRRSREYYENDDSYRGTYDRDRRYDRYADDYHRSYGRDDDYYRGRGSRRERERDHSRDPSLDSRRWEDDGRSSSRRQRKEDHDDFDRPRKRSRSRSRDKSRRKKSKRRNRSRSRSHSRSGSPPFETKK